jgi:hypothetical protein
MIALLHKQHYILVLRLANMPEHTTEKITQF